MAAITGAHAIIYSTDSDADRAFLRDVLAFPHVDVGRGWLIFALPPAEIAVHPAENSSGHEVYLMVDDVRAFTTEMATRGLSCTPAQDQGWGVVTQLTLPGGGQLGVYEPRHARPAWPAARASQRRKSRKPQPKRRTTVAKKASASKRKSKASGRARRRTR